MGDRVVMNSFFFSKQKTAYEMRISDWSSDVCSSDLFQIRKASGRVARGPAFRRAIWHPPLRWPSRGPVGQRALRGSRSQDAWPPPDKKQWRTGRTCHEHAPFAPHQLRFVRAAERRVGEKGCSTGRSRWTAEPKKN